MNSIFPPFMRDKNDTEGASAFDPAVLIHIILLAYSRGIVSSRKIEATCRENALFIAVSGDSQPHFTTLAAFVSTMGDMVAKLFTQVLLIGDRQGLIGRDMFAINGVKLPANASKAKSGTRADLQRWRRCLATCGATNDRTVLRCAEKPRPMGNGSCTT